MIDLSKPIRWKSDKVPILHVAKGSCHWLLEWRNWDSGIGGTSMTWQELEDAVENIPEPRKPREWWLEFCGKEVKSIYDSHYQGKTRVIEWPDGAPLPDWPEGEGS